MSRQVRRRRHEVPPEVHIEPRAFLEASFRGRQVSAVVRDPAGRWGAVLDGQHVVWIGHEREIVPPGAMGRWLIDHGYLPEGWRPPSMRFGRWFLGALRRVHLQQQKGKGQSL